MLNSSIYYHLAIVSSLAQANTVWIQQINNAFRISHEYVILSLSPLLCHKTKLPSSLAGLLASSLVPLPPLQCIFHTKASDLASQDINQIITLL